MRKAIAVLSYVLMMPALPGRAEMLQIDLSIYGMD
jgi:hypothetical protein